MSALLFLLGIISIALIILFFTYREKVSRVCAFDLDNTITHGIKQAAEAIKTCKDNGYKIAIITARPSPWYDDLQLEKLGLKEKDFLDNFYYGDDHNKCSFIDTECLQSAVSKTKVKHLRTIADKYDIKNPKNIILFDDQYSNIQAAEFAGFSAIHANATAKGGLPVNISERILELCK